jgi:hypothetical protein
MTTIYEDLPRKLMDMARREALTDADRLELGRAIYAIQAGGKLLAAAHLTLATFNGRGLSMPEVAGDALVAAIAQADR